ncbi:toll/interleukin-1 receptor domain-containing protein [Dyadobacter endophyticus]|uniref:toll/interleukin-1 receptor domain-containing protein n=1 Tax=Dyadobacter endophyticus TaxID=1749036 RepID=UPI003CED769D
MAFITRDYLDRFYSNLGSAKAQDMRQRPSMLTESQKASYKKVIFLSHSHKDKDIVEKVALFLLSQGTFLYVDWKDSSMPPVTSAETANKIKSRIQSCDEFVVLASNNALDSKWVPWELGFADAAKGMSKVFIFPIADNDGKWRGSEYFDLYQKIELGREETKTAMTETVVRQPEFTYVAHSLKYKLKQNSDSQLYKVQ